jgi:hypothetical protein
MTTNDPFANPPGTPTPDASEPATPPPFEAPGSPAPGVLAPGMLTPQAPPPPPPAVGAFPAPAGPPPLAPKGIAQWALVTTGFYTLLALGSALLTPFIIEELKSALEDPDNPQMSPLSTLSGLAGNAVAIASFVMLALWMSRIRANRTRLGDTPGGPPAVEWWGWFIPVAWFVLPLLGMRAITRRIVGWGVLLGWWIPFCAMWLVTYVSSSAQFRAIDFATGELTRPEVLDQMVPLAWASAVLLAISWLFLVVIIRKTTARHLSV